MEKYADFYKILEERGFLEWCSSPDEFREELSKGMVTGYVGFDPTSDSLHVGNMIPIMGLAWLQRCGHRPITIAGGGTGMIGDPSGKSKERNLLTLEQMQINLVGVKKQLAHFLNFESGENRAIMVNNYDWLSKLAMIDFLRDVGKYFSINYMIGREYVRSRIEDPEKSISFTEFSYMLLQSYDFYHLFKEYNCIVQFGGNDQQGNILAGVDYIRKSIGGQAFGCTYKLLLTASGAKFGKTEEGAVWLDPRKTSTYKFYQFWVNADDRDVIKLIKLYTFIPLDEIAYMETEHNANPEKRLAHKKLAYEVTKMVHGEHAASSAETCSRILFGVDAELTPEILEMLSGEVPTSKWQGSLPASLVDIASSCGVFASKGEGKRLIKGGGVYVNNERVSDEGFIVDKDKLIAERYLFLRLGKKRYHLILL